MDIQHVSPRMIWATGAGIMGLMLAIISWQRRHISTQGQPRPLNNHLKAQASTHTIPVQDPVPEIEGVIVVHLKAENDRYYQGYELLQALLSAGFRYGDQKIFHYHAPNQNDDQERTVFSLASMQKPGTFDIDIMGGCRCSGLTLFMSLKGKQAPLKDFTLMMDAAASLLEDLGGVMLSEDRQPMSEAAYRRLVERLQVKKLATAEA